MRTSRTDWRAVVVLTLLCGTPVRADNVDPANDGSQYAWGANVGWLNGEPNGDGGDGIAVTDFDLTGWVWAQNTGWISLSCENEGTCDTVDYRVTNDCAGTLGGFAWAPNVGWIRFDSTAGGVTIDPASGDFAGYAWAANVGWISFGCENTSTCGDVVYGPNTAWRPSSTAPSIVPGLILTELGTTVLNWNDTAPAFDVVRGDLSTLRASGGDFGAATEACIVAGGTLPQSSVSEVPAPNQGFWFLVRAKNCAGSGSYDSGSPSQVAPRDSLVGASPQACP